MFARATQYNAMCLFCCKNTSNWSVESDLLQHFTEHIHLYAKSVTHLFEELNYMYTYAINRYVLKLVFDTTVIIIFLCNIRFCITHKYDFIFLILWNYSVIFNFLAHRFIAFPWFSCLWLFNKYLSPIILHFIWNRNRIYFLWRYTS